MRKLPVHHLRNVETASSLMLLIALIGLCSFFTWKSPHFLTAGNFKVIAGNYSVIAVATVGMALLMISGPVDLSIGSIVGATGTLMALSVHDWGWPAGAAIAVRHRPRCRRSARSTGCSSRCSGSTR